MLSWRFGNAYLAYSAMWRSAMWTWQLAKWSLQHGKVVRSTKLLAKWTWQKRKHQLDKDLRKIRKTNLAKLTKQRVLHNTFLDRVWGWWQVPIWWSWASWSHFATIFYSELCVLPQYLKLGCENYFAGLHIDHHWRCSNKDNSTWKWEFLFVNLQAEWGYTLTNSPDLFPGSSCATSCPCCLFSCSTATSSTDQFWHPSATQYTCQDPQEILDPDLETEKQGN